MFQLICLNNHIYLVFFGMYWLGYRHDWQCRCKLPKGQEEVSEVAFMVCLEVITYVF